MSELLPSPEYVPASGNSARARCPCTRASAALPYHNDAPAPPGSSSQTLTLAFGHGATSTTTSRMPTCVRDHAGLSFLLACVATFPRIHLGADLHHQELAASSLSRASSLECLAMTPSR